MDVATEQFGREERAAAPSAAPDLYRLAGVGVKLNAVAGPMQILKDVSFYAAQGEVVSIVGRSGTGKTTLLRLLAGLLKPTEGTVNFEGAHVVGPPEGVVTVFQDYTNALLPWRSVRKNIELPLESTHRKAERRAIANDVLELVGLPTRGNDYP